MHGRDAHATRGKTWAGRALTALFEVGAGVALDEHVVVPLVEVEVFAVDFDFAALEVGGFGAEGEFGRDEIAAVVEVDDHAVSVLVSEVEVADAGVVGFLHAVGGIGGEPAPGGDVDFGPVVHGPADGFGFPTGLPAGGDAGEAAHGDEERGLDAAVTATGGHALVGEAVDRAVLVLGVVGDVGVDPMEDLAGLGEGVGFGADDLLDLVADGGGERDVWGTLGEIGFSPVGED